jgi:hypothetical protein
MSIIKGSYIEGWHLDSERTDLDRIKEFGLPLDYMGRWYALTIMAEAGPDAFESLQPIPPVADCIGQMNHSSAFKGLAIKRCNSKKVSEIDALAAEFNNRLPEIKNEKKVEVLMEFYRRAKEIYDRK